MSRALLVLAVLAAACHHDKSTKTTPNPVPPAPAAATAQQPAQQDHREVPVSGNVGAGSELVRQCQLHFDNTDQAPKFDFDEFKLTMQDRAVLEQIAQCVTKGPLKGRRLQLVGRADPRGTEEYNMGLGDHRAHSVASYLEHLGVSTAAIEAKTRGALDAAGTDDATWRKDRRVDVDLE
jgi:peptidoglycan-associated lipoprotein